MGRSRGFADAVCPTRPLSKCAAVVASFRASEHLKTPRRYSSTLLVAAAAVFSAEIFWGRGFLRRGYFLGAAARAEAISRVRVALHACLRRNSEAPTLRMWRFSYIWMRVEFRVEFRVVQEWSVEDRAASPRTFASGGLSAFSFS